MMASNRFFSFLLFFLLTASFAASSTFISDDVFESHGSTGRTLLQAKKGCPVNFEFLNYTIITSKCKGPQYPPNLCCGALKDFACPYADQINDPTNNCATTMFSYITGIGKYPPGLFASECHEGKEGLACPASAPETSTEESTNKSNGQIVSTHSPILMLMAGFLVFLFHLF